MFCVKCGREKSKEGNFCSGCGFNFGSLKIIEDKYKENREPSILQENEFVKQENLLEANQNIIDTNQVINDQNQIDLPSKNKVVAGIFQMFLGIFGVGRFYLGHKKIAAIHLSTTVIALMAIIYYSMNSELIMEQSSTNSYIAYYSYGPLLSFGVFTICFNLLFNFISGAMMLGAKESIFYKEPQKENTYYYVIAIVIIAVISFLIHTR